jgi:predicted ATP-dependent endonuclease of OLD family
MKIKKLIVRNYKLFDDLELNFTDQQGQILDTIVLAGLNGTGKTTILELIENLINGTLSQKEIQPKTQITLQLVLNRSFQPDGHLKKSIESKSYLSGEAISKHHTLITFDLSNHEKNSFPTISFESASVALSKTVNTSLNAFSDAFSTDFLSVSDKKKGLYLYASDRQQKRQIGLNLNRTSLNSDQEKIQETILKSIQKQVFANPDRTPRQVFVQKIQELNQVFESLNLYSKLVHVNEKELIFESFNKQLVHFEALSSGEKMLYYMGFMLNHFNLENTLLLVDQPEDALHPTWQQQITGFFKKIGQKNQVILATHSPQVIASVHPESVFVLGAADKHQIKAFNMAAEHKNCYGVDSNRILSEIMGTPIRSFEAQQRIDGVNQSIKQFELQPALDLLQTIESQIDTLAIDFGKQDAAVMRLRNELRLLKRNVELKK